MLQGLAKAKALKELQALVNSKASLNGLALAKSLKRQNELRLDLGMGKSTPANTNPKQEYADTLLFNKSGQILLTQRSAKDDFKPNKWWIVGGKIEQGETPEQGAIRELAEETGVKLFDLKFLEKVNLPTGGISHRFAEVVKDDTPIHLKKDELQAYEWVDADKLGEFDLLGTLADLRKLVNKAGQEVGVIPLDDEHIERLSQTPIDDTQDMGQGGRKGVAKKWVQNNLVGKKVLTSDGKIVHLNSNDTAEHIPYNVRRNALLVQCIPFVPAIFAKGQYDGPGELDQLHQAQRKDQSITNFHLYSKWVELKNGYKVNAEVQACERENNKKELFYAGYNLKVLEKKRATPNSLPYQGLHPADAVHNNTTLLPNETSNPLGMAYTYDNLMLDKMQDDVEMVAHIVPLRILQVLDENGTDITDEVLSDGWDGNDKTADIPQMAYRPTNKKVQALINQQRINLADVEYLDLNLVESLVQNFGVVKQSAIVQAIKTTHLMNFCSFIY